VGHAQESVGFIVCWKGSFVGIGSVLYGMLFLCLMWCLGEREFKNSWQHWASFA